MLRALLVTGCIVACGSDPLVTGEPDAGSEPICRNGPVADDVCGRGPGFAEAPAPIEVTSVRATIVDAGEEPVAELMVFICGTLVCSLPERTDAEGRVSIAFPGAIEKPAFKFGDGLSHGRFAALLEPSSEEVDLGTLGTPTLPDNGACLSPGSTAESGGVRLHLPDDARVEVLPIDYPNEADRTFRAAELPIALAAPGLDGGEELEALFALAPTGASVCPPASLELPNVPGYAPGTEVDILLNGVDIEEQWAPYGGWVPTGVGRVDASGERIEMIEGGLPVISNVGVRAR